MSGYELSTDMALVYHKHKCGPQTEIPDLVSHSVYEIVECVGNLRNTTK